MTLAWVAAIVCAASAPAYAQSDSTSIGTTGAAAMDSSGAVVDSAAFALPIEMVQDTVETNELHLRRAAFEQVHGNYPAVIENLEQIDFATLPNFEEADRAAFLLANAYLQLGGDARFVPLAEQVTGWGVNTPYTAWIGYQLLVVQSRHSGETTEATARWASQAVDGDAAADALATGILLRSGDNQAAMQRIASADKSDETRILRDYLEAVALRAAGSDDTDALKKVAKTEPQTDLDRTLVGAALLHLSERTLEDGKYSEDWLRKVPPGSRYYSRARHMLGVMNIEKGDVEGGKQILRELLASDSTYADRNGVAIALAGQSLEARDWEAAYNTYDQTEREWQAQRQGLEQFHASGDVDALWDQWKANGPLSDVITLDALPAYLLSQQLADASTRIDESTTVEPPALPQPDAQWTLRWAIAPPAESSRDSVAESAQMLENARYEQERLQGQISRESERLGSQRTYFSYGGRQVDDELALLRERAALLDSITGSLGLTLAKLDHIRDESTRRVAERTKKILEDAAAQILWVRAMRHYYIGGPYRDREYSIPQNVPTPHELTREEIVLTEAIRAFAERMEAEAPGIIARSLDGVWGPQILDRAHRQNDEAAGYLAWARALRGSIDSTLVAKGSSIELRRLEDDLVRQTASVDSLQLAHRELRSRIGMAAVAAALERMDEEREAIDYGLATASYAMSVGLAGVDSTQSVDEIPDNPEAARWRKLSLVHLQQFLDRHPDSPSRAEVRFELADLMLIDARHEFTEKMARFVNARGGDTVTLPILDFAPALDVYQSILEEDPDYAHRDAVLFNAGMILVEGADPKAETYLTELVTQFPDSPLCQESYLRLGDMRFNEKSFTPAVELYGRATEGEDTGIRLIALFKMGWAYFNVDQFVNAADAFRQVLDLYASEEAASGEVDVANEAESYMIHSLARAGGADVFRDYFDRIGPRPYEMKLLLALGQHFRRFSLYGEAAEVDKLHIERDPHHPDALLSAQRMTDTYRRWDRKDDHRSAQRSYAAQFAPGSSWYEAQESDSVREAGTEFAKKNWTSLAVHHHTTALENGNDQDWSEALGLYETLLSHWPDDEKAPNYSLHAGESSAQLGEYEKALAHYGNAAATGTDSIPELALRQRVAVTDRWYETTRGAGSEATGDSSLARRVLTSGDELLTRYPQHDGGDDIRWRQGNLAYAHGWYERAADEFALMSRQYPNDERVPVGASLRADALFAIGDYETAGVAFEDAERAAERAGLDSLAQRARESIPVCYYRHAESAVAADSSDYGRHAALFESFAARFPDYEHAHSAQYRASLAYLNAGRAEDGVRALQTLIRNYPESEYVMDSYLTIARTWEESGESQRAADAYLDFSERYPEDENSDEAVLKAADLYASAGQSDRADEVRLEYVERFPGDTATGMEIMEDFARRDLAKVGAGVSISSLLAGGSSGADNSHLVDYLQRADTLQELASPELIAQVRFLQGEEAREAYDAVRITLPLKESIARKQQQLDRVLASYRQSAELGVTEWAHASAFRIGQVLVAFGDALVESERPSDLGEDDLIAYEDVLYGEGQVFFDRGEDVWSDMLRQSMEKDEQDDWTAQAKEALYGRLAQRFFYRAEVEYPTIAGIAPVRAAPPAPPIVDTNAAVSEDSTVPTDSVPSGNEGSEE